MPENSNTDELYNPDFNLIKQQTNHTTARSKYIDWYNLTFREPFLEIFRDYSYSDTNNKIIPITKIDEIIGISKTIGIEKSSIDQISLGKNNLYLKVKDALETEAIKKNIIKHTLYIENNYTIPIIDNLIQNNKLKKHNEIISNIPRERTIIINGNSYSSLKKYKRIGGGLFVPLKIPIDIDDKLNIKLTQEECYCRISKEMKNKNIIKITLSQECEITSLCIIPEPMIFDKIHDTTMNCDKNCAKEKHYITCLKNDPGFICSFELSIRSSLTNDLWISVGTFNGNKNFFESVKISLGKILVKEFRLINIKFHNSIDKISISPIQCNNAINKISDDYVIYKLIEPLDGKYYKTYDKVIDKDHCVYDDYYGKPKGNETKKRSLFMKEALEL